MKEPIERRTITAQLADRIEEQILAGEWRGVLPGRRTLAARYGVNVKTSAAAVDLLEHRGLVAPAVIGKERKILAQPRRQHTRKRASWQRLLIIHQSSRQLNVDDLRLLQRMSELWERTHGESAWTRVDYLRCKSPGSMLDTLIKRHSADALVLHMPASGWGTQAAKRIPCYQAGGPYDADAPVSLGACSLRTEVSRLVAHLHVLGHRRILIPTEGLGEEMRRSIIDALEEGSGGEKPLIGNWEDFVPCFPESVPEAWSRYWTKALGSLRPTAVLVLEDTHLLSLYGHCFTHGIRIPDDLSVISWNYESRFEWLKPRPVMMRYPTHLALAHFQQWLDGGMKAIGRKYFELEMVEGESVSPPGS